MGNKYSTPGCFGYSKLTSSSSDDDHDQSKHQQPLLLDMDIGSYTSYNKPPLSSLLQGFDIKQDMEKLGNAKLEKKVMRMATTIDQLIKAESVRSSEHKEEMAKLAKKNADLEKRFITMATAVGSLKKPSPPPLPLPPPQVEKNGAALEKTVLEMASTINLLKTASNAHLGNEEDIRKLTRKNAELEKTVLQLSSIIDQLKNSSSPFLINATKSKAFALRQQQPLGPRMDELIICVYVLVFLVCVLIGVSL